MNFQRTLASETFLFSLFTLSHFLTTTRPLSTLLQASDMDVYRAMQSISTCEASIASNREDSSFSSIYDKVQSVLGEDVEISTPRVCSRQTKRSNPPADNAFDYYRRAIYLPYLDTVVSQLHERFAKHQKIFKGLFSLLPSVLLEDDPDPSKSLQESTAR